MMARAQPEMCASAIELDPEQPMAGVLPVFQGLDRQIDSEGEFTAYH